ncbi:MAG TPA: ATP-binding protein [Polyangiales bacterium]|nr:ATP-binding protein [Polyangiales bacterium]
MAEPSQLKELTSGLRLIAQKLPVIVWNTDDKLRVTALAGAGLFMQGVQAEQYIGRSLLEQFSSVRAEQEATIIAAHQQALQGASVQLLGSYRDREYEIYVQQLRSDTGAVIGCTGVALDVTAQTQLARERGVWQAHIRHQQRLESIGTLASGVAHEINNPVQSIMNYAQLIARRTGVPDIATYAQEVLQEAQRVAAIVKGLLSFARQEGEPYTDVHPRELIDSTLALVSALLRKDGIRVEQSLGADLPAIRCHPQQIQQVLMNLIGNAREALNARYPGQDSDKCLLLTGRAWRREGASFVRLTVEDHGIGIPQPALDKIFDPFWTSKSGGHAGLGLAVAQGIVVEHGGAISVESEPGRLTRMHVDLMSSQLSAACGKQSHGAHGANERR